MLHLDLFSGIGGFAYAVDQVWGDAEHIFCDNDKFCQAVLKKHWPGSVIYDDIKDITDTYDWGQTKQKEQTTGNKQYSGVGLLTGGFPCQPFSAAGVRLGTADERYLWPEMLRVIRLSQPQWVIAENVRGLLTWEGGLVFEQICTDLETEGYEVWPFIIPALAVNAPHRRDRIWWIAANAEHRGRKSQQREPRIPSASDRSQTNTTSVNGSWDKDWLEVATELCSVDDGLPAELGDATISKAKHRAEQLKAYGNAIVPQVAVEIMKGIKDG